VVEEVPPAKRRREGEMTEGELQRRLLGLLGGLDQRLGEVRDAISEVAQEVRRGSAAQDAHTRIVEGMLARLADGVSPRFLHPRTFASVSSVAESSRKLRMQCEVRPPADPMAVDVPIEDATGEDDTGEDTEMSGENAEAEVMAAVSAKTSEEEDEDEDDEV
jgi:hypothetical protein